MSAIVSSNRATQGRGRIALSDSTRGWCAEEIAAKSPYLLERDPQFDQRVEWCRRGSGVVFAMKHAHSMVEIADRLKWALLARCALMMTHDRLRQIHDLPAILLDSVGPVEILAVHKVGLVEQPDLTDNRRAHEHT